MDLSVSPDVEAFFCYLLVLATGAFVASGQLAKIKGALGMPEAWLLFLAYALVPVLLFWLLDRSGAIHDTSLFAAVLVGFGYHQILEGSLQTIKASSDLSFFWKPFVAWSDRLAMRITHRRIRRDNRLRERMLSDLARNPERLEKLKQLTLVRCGPQQAIAAFQTKIEEVTKTYASFGQDAVNENLAKLLYETLESTEDFQYLLYQRGITPKSTYYWYAYDWRGKCYALGAALLLAIATALGIWQLNTTETKVRYYAWRLQKPNSTSYDRVRAQNALLRYLACDPKHHVACYELAALLKHPGLSMQSVDTILHLLIRDHHKTPEMKDQLVEYLIDALRSDNLDVRARIHPALQHLASHSGLEVEPDLAKWTPTQGDSITALEQRIAWWERTFHPSPNKPQSGPSSQPPPSNGGGGNPELSQRLGR